MGPIHIPNTWIRQHLKYSDLFPALRLALQDYTNSKKGALNHDAVQQPLRTRVPLPQGCLYCMPAYVKSSNALAVKMLTDQPNNPPSRPSIQGTICLFDADEGHVLATMDAEEVTAKRTAAVSALGWDALRKLRGISHADSPAIISIIGTGVQAEAHVHALLASLEEGDGDEKCQEIRVFSRQMTKAETFCRLRREDSDPRVNFKSCNSVEECVQGSDVIFVATSSETPVLNCSLHDMKKGCIILSVGACQPTQREIADELLGHASIWVDCREACSLEAGDIRKCSDSVVGEIGELLSMVSSNLGVDMKNNRVTQIDIVKTVGLALEDAVAAKKVFEIYSSPINSD